ncbi:MAG: ACP S-malonyltransferase [Lachnospiraceae bacterium]|nr:ACP S-malonyltransferase [Lachnospiraceae bacterium]
MGKIAFVFSGQGDQYPGMGKDLYDKYPVAKEVFKLCDEIRPGTSGQCFEGTEDELKETKNTQSCLFATELAEALILKEKGIVPDAVAGFSLGEVVAATVGGVFDNETGFKLVCRRGELMQHEAEKSDTFMAAVLKLTYEQVKLICCMHTGVYPVNFNTPGQISVAGLSSEREGFLEDVKTVGGRAVLLKVNGAFHSPFMEDAAKGFAEELSKVKIQKSSIPLYSNKTGKPYEDNAAELLSEQICNPVRWEKTIRNMIEDGVDTFVEIGPGRTLTNMIKKIDGDVKSVSFAEFLKEV